MVQHSPKQNYVSLIIFLKKWETRLILSTKTEQKMKISPEIYLTTPVIPISGALRSNIWLKSIHLSWTFLFFSFHVNSIPAHDTDAFDRFSWSIGWIWSNVSVGCIEDEFNSEECWNMLPYFLFLFFLKKVIRKNFKKFKLPGVIKWKAWWELLITWKKAKNWRNFHLVCFSFFFEFNKEKIH